MKHSVKSLVAVAAAAFAMQAFADTETANGFTWSYRLIDNGKSAEITSGVQYVIATERYLYPGTIDIYNTLALERANS